MNLTIRNLGRLQSATIDLDKPFIVFVGRNNTSKTYVAHTIYGLYRYAAEYFQGAAGRLLAEGTALSELPRFDLDVVEFIGANLQALVSGCGEDLTARLTNIFATDDRFVEATEITLSLGIEAASIRDRVLAMPYRHDVGVPGWSVRFTKAAGHRDMTIGPLLPSVPVTGDAETAQRQLWLPFIVRQSLGHFLREALLPAGNHPFMLSTERSAIQLFSRELFGKRSELVDTVLEKPLPESIEQVQREARLYPLAIRDGLAAANAMPRLEQIRSPIAPLADKLEALLGGSVKVDEAGDLTFHPTGRSEALGLHLSSSSVKSLAGLAFYLRHIAHPRRLLVIDEPELNLHPDNQRKVTRILAALARSGVRVLISTHSDYIIRELNNLILLHREDALALRQKYGYSESETLPPDAVGAYLFDETSAHPLEIEKTGIEVASIDDEINALNRISKDIYFSLVSPDPTT